MKGERKKRLREKEARENRFGISLVVLAVVSSGLMVWGILSIVPIASPTQMVAAQASQARKNPLPQPRSTEYAGFDSQSAQYPHYQSITFANLSAYPFNLTDGMVGGTAATGTSSSAILQQIPNVIQSLSDKKVAVTGFMLPVQLKGKFTTEFLLLQNRSACCFGLTPQINEWIIARAKGKNAEPRLDVPVTVLGTFHVGEQRENGELAGIYELDCDRVIEPDK